MRSTIDRRFHSRRNDPMAYAFRADGALDPGTKLLDIGLHGYTPIGALRTLADKPLHMSVALHEITHFLSLENTLGHLLSIRALRARSHSDGVRHLCASGAEVDRNVLYFYGSLHQKYRLLMEAWRPFLEGLAVYVQTHRPKETSDALIDPVSLLIKWKLTVMALCGITKPAPRPHPGQMGGIDDGFLDACYRAIHEGPRLKLGDRTLAASLEMLNPRGLRPYFLGHAYVRAIQRRLARAGPEYEAAEAFIALVMRLLRSSTTRLLTGGPRWDHPEGAERVYGWLDRISAAGPERIRALASQDDTVDVLRFLETGEVTSGYGGSDVDAFHRLCEVAPDELALLSAEDAAEIAAKRGDAPPMWSSDEIAERTARGWIGGTTLLNLCTGGACAASGWILGGFGDKHALRVEVDDQQWWISATDADLRRLVLKPAELPLLDASAMQTPDASTPTTARRRIGIDCFSTYVTSIWELPVELPLSGPGFVFELFNPDRREESVLAFAAPALPGHAKAHLDCLATDTNTYEMHARTLELRRMVSTPSSPRELAGEFRHRGHSSNALLLDTLVTKEELAVSRVEDHVNRRILRALLGDTSASELRVPLLSNGIGVVPGATELEPLVAAAYAGNLPVSLDSLDAVTDLTRRANEQSIQAIGKPLFEWAPDAQRVSYCGLWGDRPDDCDPTS
jgi:hypothetical protein